MAAQINTLEVFFRCFFLSAFWHRFWVVFLKLETCKISNMEEFESFCRPFGGHQASQEAEILTTRSSRLPGRATAPKRCSKNNFFDKFPRKLSRSPPTQQLLLQEWRDKWPTLGDVHYAPEILDRDACGLCPCIFSSPHLGCSVLSCSS